MVLSSDVLLASNKIGCLALKQPSPSPFPPGFLLHRLEEGWL